MCAAGINLFVNRDLIYSVSAASAALFGDSEDSAKSQKLHDQGKTQQRSAEQ